MLHFFIVIPTKEQSARHSYDTSTDPCCNSEASNNQSRICPESLHSYIIPPVIIQ